MSIDAATPHPRPLSRKGRGESDAARQAPRPPEIFSPSRDIFAGGRYFRRPETSALREITNPLLTSNLQHGEVVFDGQVEILGRQFQRTALV